MFHAVVVELLIHSDDCLLMICAASGSTNLRCPILLTQLDISSFKCTLSGLLMACITFCQASQACVQVLSMLSARLVVRTPPVGSHTIWCASVSVLCSVA